MPRERPIEIREESCDEVTAYAQIPIAFEVTSIFDVIEGTTGDGNKQLVERRIADPYVKECDVPGNTPADWAKRFDVSKWGLFAARVDGELVGGAVVVANDDGIDMLDGRDDLAVLWDLRVAPAFRGQGIGSALFAAAGRWAIERGCRELKVETQNNNVPACRFYESQGCKLRKVRRHAYEEFPDEIMLLWFKTL